MNSTVKSSLLIAPVLGVLGTIASAGSHTWDVNEVFSNADGTIQFIELRETGGGAGETGLPGHNLTSNGETYFITGGPLTGPTSFRHFLIATQGFADLPGAPVPDRILPVSNVPFFSAALGDTVTYVPWDSMTFGAGVVPTNGLDSWNEGTGVALNSPTNYAGVTGSVDASSQTFCDASDGSDASCPCSNPGNPDAGCDNPQATGGVSLTIVAQTTSPNGATLQGTGFSAMASPTAILIRSDSLDPLAPVVFGDGLRCVNATPLVRLAATTAAAGSSTHTFGHNSMAGAGTFYYQIWYRSTPQSFCDPAAAYNLSNGRFLDW